MVTKQRDWVYIRIFKLKFSIHKNKKEPKTMYNIINHALSFLCLAINIKPHITPKEAKPIPV